MVDFLEWESTISLHQVFASGESYSYPHLVSDGSGAIVYLTSVKHQKSRMALMLYVDGEHHCLTPEPFNLRTRVNEYGGRPFWLQGTEVVFCNDADQCLYRLDVSDLGANSPTRLTPQLHGAERYMYTDVQPVGTGYLSIVEHQLGADEVGQDAQQQNQMILAYLHGGEKEPVTIQQGADFYSNLVISCDQQRVAWVQWNHPCMPWDQNELWTAKLRLEHDRVVLEDVERVELPATSSVCQLFFAANGMLFFSADFAGESAQTSPSTARDFWNVYAYEPSSRRLQQVTHEALEFGYPHWQYGDQRMAQLDRENLLVIGSSPMTDTLVKINTNSLGVTPVAGKTATIQHLASDGQGRAVAVLLAQKVAPELVTLQMRDTDLRVQSAFQQAASEVECGVPEHVRFDTRDGAVAHGFYYSPHNSGYQDSNSSLAPPLIVMVHGGPTARAYGHFDIQKQFWTSRGFAVFDVNHRGSSGYGRQYRDALYGFWGDRDISDIIDGVKMLVDTNRADAARLCIRGKSAGGYAVLRALTEYPGFFRAGACYYGIGNLETLAATTHKFEKYYTDRLIGESYSDRPTDPAQSAYIQRSPIHQLQRLESAMIVFQGSLDKVVPPTVAQEIIEVLSHAGLPHEYVEFADEAHGFRQVENNIDALGKELTFYRAVLS